MATHAQAPHAPVRVAVVDDDECPRDLVRRSLVRRNGYVCVGAWDTAERALRELPVARPDVLVVDIMLPGISGIEFAQIVHERFPKVRLLMLTCRDDRAAIFAALDAGAQGYAVKPLNVSELDAAIQDVLNGGGFLAAQAVAVLVGFYHHASAPLQNLWLQCLTPREREIVQKLLAGKSDKEIADQCVISIWTVNHHLRNIYEKFGVHSRGEAIARLH